MDPKSAHGYGFYDAPPNTIKNFRHSLPSQDIADGERYRALRTAICAEDGITPNEFDTKADEVVLAGSGT